ncbi:MAG: small multi-drug export protein [Methanolinea sp.]|nr:small multi-drug export protein [Methanolinea sp.]
MASDVRALGGALIGRDSPLSLLFSLSIAPLLAFLYFSLCFFTLPPEKALVLGGLMILYYIPPSGKESLIPLGIALGIPWWLMATSLALLDVLTSLFMILNFRFALRIPVLGPWISTFLDSGEEFMKKRPWISRWSVLGVAFFVFLPFQGTGGVGATLVGVLVGLSPSRILLAVAIGASAECLLFALGSDIIWRLILENLAFGAGVALAVIACGALIYLFLQRWYDGGGE